MGDFSLNSFFETDEFNSLDEWSRGLLKEFSQRAAGKPPAETMAIFMEYHGKLNKSGKIDADKRKMLVGALKSGLSPIERKKLEVFEQMLANGR